MTQLLDQQTPNKENPTSLSYLEEQEILDKKFEELTSQLGDLLEIYPLITVTKKPEETGKIDQEDKIETFLSEISSQKMENLRHNLKQNQLLQKATNQIIENENLQSKLLKNGYTEDSVEVLKSKGLLDNLNQFRSQILCAVKLLHAFNTVLKSENKNTTEYQNLRNRLAISIGDFYDTIYGKVEPVFIKNALNTKSGQKIIETVKQENPEFYSKIEQKLQPYFVDDKNKDFFQEKSDIKLYQPLTDSILNQSKHFLPQEMLTFEKSEDEISQEDMGRYAQEILDNLYKDEKYLDIKPEGKWQVELTNRSSCSANQATKKLEIPNKNYTKSQFLGSMYHEVFIHILRNINGSKISNLPFLRDYLDFEEGVASTIAYVPTNKTEVSFGSQPARMIIALASIGLSYLEVQKVLEINGKKNVFPSLSRIYRGTAIPVNQESDNPEVNKAIYHKDKAYFQGSYKVYLMLKTYDETKDLHLKSAMQKVFDNILIHKFDATNLSHILYLK